ncbi:MAG TPA: universal stress protein [Bacteroidales bacterium]|nr:universal stress protein [Bacteroidales bacterium]
MISMKNILVAIDFSKGSIHAFRYALMLAGQLGSDISMLWVDNETGIGSGLSIDDNEYRNEAIRSFNELISTYSIDFKGEINYKMRRGKVYQEVSNMAKMNGAELIIAGTHGVTGFEQYWIGSNAYRIVSYAPCPVITVRFDYQFHHDIKNVVLPIDATPDTRQKIPFACSLTKALGANLHIVGLNSMNLKSMQRKTASNVEQAVEYCNKEGLEHTVSEIQSPDVTRAIINHAISTKADIIAIMTEQQRSASGLLIGPQAQQLVNFSPIPVLSIQPKEIYSFTAR